MADTSHAGPRRVVLVIVAVTALAAAGAAVALVAVSRQRAGREGHNPPTTRPLATATQPSTGPSTRSAATVVPLPVAPPPKVIRKPVREIYAGGGNVYVIAFAPGGRFALAIQHYAVGHGPSAEVHSSRWRLIDIERGEGVVDSPRFFSEAVQASVTRDGSRALLTGYALDDGRRLTRWSAPYSGLWDLNRIQAVTPWGKLDVEE